MKILRDRLVGKTFRSMVKSLDTCSIMFSDGSAITVYTAIKAYMRIKLTQDIVTDVTEEQKGVLLTFGEDSWLLISTDDTVISSPEIFVFQDTDGTQIVETV